MNFDYGYNYNYYPQTEYSGLERFLGIFLSVYLIVIALLLAAALVSYILHSIGIYTIGKRLGKRHAWLAFIPYARKYFHGELAGEIPLKSKSIKNPGVWKLVFPIAYNVVMGVILAFLVIAVIAGAALTQGVSGGNTGAALVMGMTGLIVVYCVLIVVAMLYRAVYAVLCILININIFRKFTTDNMAVVHAVLAALIPLYESICFFVFRNRGFRS